jgi:excinuclease ABC subunit A
VIDLGPEGGGRVVAEGRPQDIAKAPKSYTGKFLGDPLKRRPAKRAPSAAAKAAE